MRRRRISQLTALTLIGLPSAGCDLGGAPTYSLFGAFFPAWLVCAVFGLLATFVMRIVMVATSLDEVMPLRLFVYSAFALLSSLGLWLVLFGER